MNDFFEGLVIIEIASVLAGPLAGSFFAELGAEVIKIENKKTGGDITRKWKNNLEDEKSQISAYYASANTYKKSIFLDFTIKEDYSEFVQYIKGADIVISNYQKKIAEKLGVDYNTVKEVNPKIIYAQLNAFEYDDPRPGYDMVMQAEAGYLSMSGTVEGESTKIPVAMMDILASHQIRASILMALIKRERGDYTGQRIDISLYKSALSGLANQASNYLMTGYIPKKMGTLHPNIAPYGEILKTKDGGEILLAIGSDEQFKKLGKTLSFTKKETNTFMTNKKRIQNRNSLNALLNRKSQEMTCGKLIKSLRKSSIPFAQIKDLKQVFSSETAKEMVIKETIEGIELLKVKNIGFKFN